MRADLALKPTLRFFYNVYFFIHLMKRLKMKNTRSELPFYCYVYKPSHWRYCNRKRTMTFSIINLK